MLDAKPFTNAFLTSHLVQILLLLQLQYDLMKQTHITVVTGQINNQWKNDFCISKANGFPFQKNSYSV